MKAMAKSKIGYCGIGADGRPVDWYYGWSLFHEPTCFPADLQLRNLPWSMPKESQE